MPGSDSTKNAVPTPALRPDPPHLDVDQVLKDELARLRPEPKSSPIEPSSSRIEPSSPRAKWWRWLFPLARKPKNEEVSPALARELFGHNLTALCLSGGGIRSASFCLGILQALAKRKLLSRFDYLSTVSGGGYIGSWLSAWRSRPEQSIAMVEESLVQYPEPKEVTTLRDFTSYMTPRRGLMSSDTWAGFATLIRNLVLNWTLFLPLLLLLVWIPKFTVLVFQLLQNCLGGSGAPLELCSPASWLSTAAAMLQNCLGGGGAPLGLCSPESFLFTAAAALYFAAELFISWQLTITEQPPQKDQQSPYGTGQTGFVVFGLLLAYIAACIGSVLVKPFQLGDGYVTFVGANWLKFAAWGALLWGLPFLLASVGVSLYNAPFKAPPGSPSPVSWRERWKLLYYLWLVLARALSGAGFGVVMVLAAAFLRYLAWQDDDRYVVVFGISGFFLAHLAGSTLFAGLSTFVPDFDAVREWSARAGGWFLVSGLIWTVYASLVLWDPQYDWPATLLPEGWPKKLIDNDWTGKVIKAGGLISGLVAALFGHSPSTPAKEGQKSGDNNWNRLAVAGAVFFSVVVIFELSRVFDWAVLPDSQSIAYLTKGHLLAPLWKCFGVAFGILVAWAVFASVFINVNKFSLHTYYRNRLIRCYLGASNNSRRPNAFTGFDEGDNLKMADQGDNLKMAELHKDEPHKLFHVINITLNLVHGENLAWQERKASSFTVSPLAAGNPSLGYRDAKEYGDKISLGTAMAISGAAASPSMGYHSSPPLALLMTLFNVRLGWWLGNPIRPRSWKISGPQLAFLPFIMELFGLTDDKGRFVYLSDGGHFENLGIYEMLRRRCRTIVVVDAACDPQFEFGDLGNAIRKARIDFGVEVSFSQLTPSPDRIATRLGLITSPTPPAPSPYCAIGRIRYPGLSAEGTLIYIKAAIHGDEPEDISSYAAACTTFGPFPHESTLDQFFTESQFESYRRLGLYIGSAVFSRQHEDGSDAVDELVKLANEHVAHAGAVT